jgi:hypothetical protein
MLVINNIDSSEAEARILANRIFYSPNVISYYDSEIKRVYPSTIDFEKYRKLQNTDINEIDTKSITYGKENKLIAAKLTLQNIETNAQDIVFYNKDGYEFWEPRLLSTVAGGSGSVDSITNQRYVLIKSNNKIEKGILNMQVIVRK